MIDLDAARAALKTAHDHVADLCEGRTKWTMRIPADEQRDSDLVIGAGLDAGEKAAAEVEILRGIAGRLAVELADLSQGTCWATPGYEHCRNEDCRRRRALLAEYRDLTGGTPS